MHERVRAKFFGTILHYLRTCSFSSGRGLAIGDSDELTRLYRLEQEHLHRWMPPFATVIEVHARTSERLRQKTSGDQESGTFSLEAVLGREEVEKLAKEIVDFLASIPYESKFWALLRGVNLDISEPIALGPVCLRQVGTTHATPRNRLLGDLLLGGPPPPDLNAENIVLETAVTGYSRQKISDSSAVQAFSLVKEFVVLAEAVDLLARSDGRTRWPAPTPLLCEVDGDPPALHWVDDVPPNALRHLDSYVLSDSVIQRPRGLFGLAAAREGGERTAAERVQEVHSRLKRLERVFARESDKNLTSLRAAAQWYFDSLAENNETTAFLFVSLGLEALLGGDRQETEGVGLKKLLANRLAYLLGGDRGARQRLIAEFQGFYNKRSDLVHGRELRLDRISLDWLTKGRQWLSMAIRKELSTL